MQFLQHFCEMLYQSNLGTMLRESNNAFSVIESVHVLSITLLVGTIAILDLRMLGLILRSVSVSRLARSVLPLSWSGFAVSVASGFLLFWQKQQRCTSIQVSGRNWFCSLLPVSMRWFFTPPSTVAPGSGKHFRYVPGGLASLPLH